MSDPKPYTLDEIDGNSREGETVVVDHQKFHATVEELANQEEYIEAWRCTYEKTHAELLKVRVELEKAQRDRKDWEEEYERACRQRGEYYQRFRESFAEAKMLREALEGLLDGMCRTHGDESDGETLFAVRLRAVDIARAALAGKGDGT